MNRNKGFTLIELLAVIVILGIILSISVVAVGSIKKKQDEANRLNVISSILTGSKAYISEQPGEISNGEISVSSIIDGDFASVDINKFSELKDKKVKIVACKNNLKLKYSIELGETYNDCGCKSQTQTGVAEELCTGEDN